MGAAFLDFGREKAAEYHFRKAPVIPVLTPSIEPLGYAVDVER